MCRVPSSSCTVISSLRLQASSSSYRSRFSSHTAHLDIHHVFPSAVSLRCPRHRRLRVVLLHLYTYDNQTGTSLDAINIIRVRGKVGGRYGGNTRIGVRVLPPPPPAHEGCCVLQMPLEVCCCQPQDKNPREARLHFNRSTDDSSSGRTRRTYILRTLFPRL